MLTVRTLALPRLALGLSIASLTLLAACASSLQLRVLTEPRDSVIEVETFAGNEQVSLNSFQNGKSELSLGKKIDRISLRASAFGHTPASRELTLAEVLALPERKEHHELILPLEREFQEITQLVVDYDQGLRRFVGRERTVRSYDDSREDSGVSVTRVYDGLQKGHGIRGMAISPDGRRLVFAEAIPAEGAGTDAAGPGGSRIVALDSCTLHSIQLIDEGGRPSSSGKTSLRSGPNTAVDPYFTPDGKNIRYSSNRHRRESADILQISASGPQGGIERIYSDTRDHTALRPTMGSNGVMVYALYPPSRGRAVEAGARIWTKGGASDYETEIIEGFQPHVSPDGKRIAYIGQDRNVHVVDVDGTNPTLLTSNAEQIVADYKKMLADPRDFDPDLFLPYSVPSWSPDGEWILYTAQEGKDSTGMPNEDIFIMRADGSEPHQLTTNGSADTHPLMDPDKRFIYFLSNRGGQWAICSIPVPSYVL